MSPPSPACTPNHPRPPPPLLSPCSSKGPGRPGSTSCPSVRPELRPHGPAAQVRRENPERYKSLGFSPFFSFKLTEHFFPPRILGTEARVEGCQQGPSLRVGSLRLLDRKDLKAHTEGSSGQAASAGPLLQAEQHRANARRTRSQGNLTVHIRSCWAQPLWPHTVKAEVLTKVKPQRHRRG